jgi:hypothetical protein
MTLVVINFGPWVEYQVVWNVVEIMLTDFIMLHVRTESYGNFMHLGLQWEQLGRTSVMEFVVHDNVGNRFGVEYQHGSVSNPTSTDQKWEIFGV